MVSRLKIGFEQSKALQAYQTLVTVASQALGGKTEESKPISSRESTPTHNIIRPQSAAEMKVAFAKVFTPNGR